MARGPGQSGRKGGGCGERLLCAGRVRLVRGAGREAGGVGVPWAREAARVGGAGAQGAGPSGGAQGGVRPVGVAVRPPSVGISVRRAARSRDAGPKGTEFDSPPPFAPRAARPARLALPLASASHAPGLALRGQLWLSSVTCRRPEPAGFLPSFSSLPFPRERAGSHRQEGRLAAGRPQPHANGTGKADVEKKGSGKAKPRGLWAQVETCGSSDPQAAFPRWGAGRLSTPQPRTPPLSKSLPP